MGNNDLPATHRRPVFASTPKGVGKWVLLLLVGIALIYGAWWTASNGRSKVANEETPPPQVSVDEPVAKREELFQSKISPLILDFDSQNAKAVGRSLDRIKGHFQDFRKGVDPFTEELTGWGTRGGIAKRLAQDKWDEWWNEADLGNRSRVRTYVNEKFEAHIVSKAKLQEMLKDAIKQFQGDLEANRNQLLIEVKTALSASDVPITIRLSDEDFEKFSKEVLQRMTANTQAFGSESLSVLVLSNLGGEAAGFAATKLVTVGGTYLIGVFTASGTATAGGAIGGGATGSIFPGVGTAIGVGVGLVVGGIVDWWMTERFKAEVAGNCNKFLSELEQFTVSGPKSSDRTSGSKSWEGFDKVLRNACDISSQSLRKAMHQSIVETPL